jgi:C-terminal processing protease CtpA/Prc
MPEGFEPAQPAPKVEKAGIGITCGRINNNDLVSAVYILAVHPNGPAAKTGRLEAMQELLSVDGWSVYGQPLHIIMERVVGDVGEYVNIEVATHSPVLFLLFPSMRRNKVLC